MGTTRRATAVDELVERARRGEARAVARLISLVEHDSPQLREAAAALAPHGGSAHVVGLTGAPGVGKSTSTSALVTALRAEGRRVGVLAVDPSSPFSGGALLGDRIRMQEHATDESVFIRSMASRGQLGGLSAAVPQALRVLEVAGYDVILVETVGVGQAELEIASLADTTLLVLAPGLGDGIQAAKAGVIEIADVFVVNKADRDGADQLVHELRHMQSLRTGPAAEGGWRPPIVRTVAAQGAGAAEVIAAVGAHRDWSRTHGEWDRRRRARARAEIEAIALGALRARMGALHDSAALADAATRVEQGTGSPYDAADELLALLRE